METFYTFFFSFFPLALPSTKVLRKGHLHGSQLPHNPAVVVLNPLVAHKSTLHARSTEEGTREG